MKKISPKSAIGTVLFLTVLILVSACGEYSASINPDSLAEITSSSIMYALFCIFCATSSSKKQGRIVQPLNKRIVVNLDYV